MNILYVWLWLVWSILQTSNISTNNQYLSERLDRDDPSGDCDCEYVDYSYPDVSFTKTDACSNWWKPVLSEIRTIDTKQQPSEVWDIINYTHNSERWIWYSCRNNKNPKWCHDYEVRFLCQK